ncbi:hypothetical protein AVEN_55821-1 [Araneus ventricosus]|uniref:Uncharacterized protein n=1 Tax=Araneus ventricosus TaxID=182803 RepID=A0A4Y2CQZ1_ARAVE|nr:hypothetical protein AVEN_55821-1 [Araneus ventricosus]
MKGVTYLKQCDDSVHFSKAFLISLLLRNTVARSKIAESGPESTSFKTRFHQRSIVYMGLVHANSDVEDPPSSHRVVRKFGVGGTGSGVVA